MGNRLRVRIDGTVSSFCQSLTVRTNAARASTAQYQRVHKLRGAAGAMTSSANRTPSEDSQLAARREAAKCDEAAKTEL